MYHLFWHDSTGMDMEGAWDQFHGNYESLAEAIAAYDPRQGNNVEILTTDSFGNLLLVATYHYHPSSTAYYNNRWIFEDWFIIQEGTAL